MPTLKYGKRLVFFIAINLLLCTLLIAQKKDSTKFDRQLGVSVTVTNNGIAVIPTFSLGKPAGFINFKAGRRLTFEPEFWFSLEGKPWANVFWVRYKIIKTKKFILNTGVHPSLVFGSSNVIENGVSSEIIKVQRYVAAEISPNYVISKNIAVGIYYLFSIGARESVNKHTHFITLNSTISDIPLFRDFYFRVSPQIYYLKIDNHDGMYYSSAFGLSKDKFPVSFQYLFNNPIHSTIAGGQDFVWNVSLIYSFNKNFVTVR